MRTFLLQFKGSPGSRETKYLTGPFCYCTSGKAALRQRGTLQGLGSPVLRSGEEVGKGD